MKKKPFYKALILIFSTTKKSKEQQQQPITELEKFSNSPEEKACNGQKFSVNYS